MKHSSSFAMPCSHMSMCDHVRNLARMYLQLPAFLMAALTLLLSIPSMKASAQCAQAYSSTGLTGAQNWPSTFGLDFDVNTPIVVTKLGAFQGTGNVANGSQNGAGSGIRVAIFNRATQSIVTGLDAVITSGTASGDYVLVSLPTSVTLPTGNYSIVAMGYNSILKDYNSQTTTSPIVTNGNSGAVSFVGTSRYDAGNSATFIYPTTTDKAAAQYGNATFEYCTGTVQNVTHPAYYTTIQSAINAASANDVIVASAATFTENITINKGITLQGANVGVAGTGSRGAETKLLDCNIDITASAPVIIDGFQIYQTDNNPDVILINGGTPATIQNNKIEGHGAAAGQPARAITTSAGSGIKTIQNNMFTGDVSGNFYSNRVTWNSGVYINGSGSTVNVTGNVFENCRTALNLDDYNSNISVSGNSFSNSGTYISFGGTTPTNGQYVFGSNDFANPVDAIINLSNVNTAFRLDITSSKLNGSVFNTLPLATLFTVEAGMYHRGRSGRNGLVTFVAGHQYVVAGLTTIQSAVDYGTGGDVINVSAGTYNERVSITKPLTIQGASNTTTIVDGTGLSGTGSGFYINNGVTNVVIKDLTIQNFSGTNPNASAGIYAIGGNNNLTIQNTIIQNNVGGSGIYANGPINAVTIDGNKISGHTGNARGIVIWNGFKQNISITNNEVFNNACCGIELQDGTASGVTVTGNNIHDNADNGLGLIGLQGPGANWIATNTLVDNGRFGIEIKLPNGNGASSGPGSIVINSNNISRTTTPASEQRDLAGISVYRRGWVAGNNNVDIPIGVVVSNNTVSGYQQPSNSDGFGIVVEGINHTVTGNTLNNNDVGIQRQAGHTPYTANTNVDGDQTNIADDYFGRGNSPVSCGITVTGNSFSGNTINTRDVGNSTGTGVVTNSTGNSFCTIQAAINDPTTTTGDVINASAGTYNEDILLNKSVTLQGAGYATTTIMGQKGGDGATVRISATGSVVDGFTITRDGNNAADWNDPTLNTSGISVQGLSVSGEVRNNRITGNRSGIDINNSNGNNIHNNIIEGNHTGVIFRNQTDNTNMQENFITGNRTVGVLFLDASGGSNSPVQTAHNSTFNNNNISGNWYGDVVDRQSGGSLPTPGTTNLKNFECNWYGAASVPSYSSANSSEPAYSSLIPVAYGGTATAPTTHTNILGPGYMNIDALPYLVSGADDPAILGFQPAPNTCSGVGPVSVASNTYFTIQAAINDPATTGANNTINVGAGTYAENVIVNKSVSILGPNAGIDPCSGARVPEAIVVPASSDIAAGEVFHVAASNVTISGLTIDGDNPAISTGYTSTTTADIDAAEGITLLESGINNLTVTNNVIRDLSDFAVYLDDYNLGVATSGHVISNNKIQDMGTYDDNSGIALWGGGVILYDNQYAAVTNNCMSNVRIGIQTGNFYRANPGSTASQMISGNTISTRRSGIFHNLFYSNASPYTVSGNTITGIANANETKWDGIAVLSMQNTASTVSGNMIDGSAITITTDNGISIWNDQVAPLVSGGTITGVAFGINVNNYEGYSSNANNTSATISGVAITNATTAGIQVHDNPSNSNGATAAAEIMGNTSISGSPTGILVLGADASANVHNNTGTIKSNTLGIDVDGGTATIYQDSISENGTGVRVSNGGKLTATTQNFIKNNTVDGIRIESTAGTIADITENDLSGNTGYAVNNAASAQITATCNWLGSTTAATAAAEISGNVTYIPYLSSGADLNSDPSDGFQKSVPCTSCDLNLAASTTFTTTAPGSGIYPMIGQEAQTIYLNYPSSAQSATFTVNATGGSGSYSYDWVRTGACSTSTNLNNNSSTYTYNPVSADACSNNSDNIYTYTITVSDNNGCSSVVTTKQMNVVNPYVSGGDVQICHRTTLRGRTNSQTLSVSPSLVSAHLAHGDYLGNCTYYIPAARGTAPAASLALGEEAQQAIIYPNPTTGIFILELSEIRVGAEIMILDMAGKLIEQKWLEKGSVPTATFDLSNYAKGLYLMELRDGTFSYQAKIVVQ